MVSYGMIATHYAVLCGEWFFWLIIRDSHNSADGWREGVHYNASIFENLDAFMSRLWLRNDMFPSHLWANPRILVRMSCISETKPEFHDN
jgi:hypothetical protein